MTAAFWALVALFGAAAAAFVVPALLGRRRRGETAGTDAANVAIYRDQIRELDADLAAGTLAPAQHDEARRELERRMLEDVSTGAPSAGAAAPSRRTALAIGIAVPVAAAALYFAVGNPQALVPGAASGDGHAITMQQIEGMADRLAARLKENPDDVKGWAMLGRTYSVMDRFPEAVTAFENALKRSPPDAQLLADYADALAMSQGRTLMGAPEKLIAQALQVDPDNIKALALAGTIAFQKHDFNGAIAHWERILKVAPPDSGMSDSIRDSIAEAQKLAGGTTQPAVPAAATAPKAATTGGAGITGTVRLSPALSAQAAPDDVVFIFARPAEGPRAPLAATRARVRDLPFAFKLDDTMAMAGMKLSDHARVVVGARVSRSGSPTPQPGDLEGLTAPMANRGSGVIVEIATRVP